MAANSTSSLTSLSFNLLFGFMPDTQINRSSRYALCIIVLHDAIEKGIPLSLANTLARLTEVRDALKLKESFETKVLNQLVVPTLTF